MSEKWSQIINGTSWFLQSCCITTVACLQSSHCFLLPLCFVHSPSWCKADGRWCLLSMPLLPLYGQQNGSHEERFLRQQQKNGYTGIHSGRKGRTGGKGAFRAQDTTGRYCFKDRTFILRAKCISLLLKQKQNQPTKPTHQTKADQKPKKNPNKMTISSQNLYL